VVNLKQEFNTPLLFVGKHTLNEIVSLADNLVVSHLLEAEFACLNQASHNLNCMSVQSWMIYLEEFCNNWN